MTPLMQQYWQIKNEYSDKILLFRMGDFYEMFFDDAKIAAPILNIALTARNKKSDDETPMCGVPHHSISGPIGKLLAAGLKVAICDQLEDPETAKGIVKRGVTRVLSPGMVYDPQTLEELNANYVAAFDETTVSFLDATTGESFYFRGSGTGRRGIFDGAFELFALLRPSEILITAEQVSDNRTTIDELKTAGAWTLTVASSRLTELDERFRNVPESAKRLLYYAAEMQGSSVLAAVREFERRAINDRMVVSQNVLRHLEVFTSLRLGSPLAPAAYSSRGSSRQDAGTLFGAINRTRTSAGARTLKRWLQFPLVSKIQIEERLNRIEEWAQKPHDLKILRERLGKMGDIERRIAKISYANCHPRDLLSLAESLDVGISVAPFCQTFSVSELNEVENSVLLIRRHLNDEPPAQLKTGGYIQRNVNDELDRLIELSENSQKLLVELETRERETTGITSLKVRYNNVFGYYIEVTKTHLDKIPDHYKRKQTLANAERFITQELQELEERILSSREKRVRLEEEIFQSLRTAVLRSGQFLLSAAQKWSDLDVISSLAWLALEQKYTRPILKEQVQDSPGLNAIVLRGSRHPVVEQEVERAFVPNDLSLSRGECLLLTGPNMAGKSTLMRQIAVTVLMAQVGSFVPASYAELPLFHQIFTRIGASDSLSEGLSTFMVEMQETAEMLKMSGPDTLVILDEVGRGTSTYDGMSLAQSILEHLVRVAGCTTLFATHYHELTILASEYAQVRNMHMAIHEQRGEIQFLYTLRAGPASKSYGLHVARLAGLPESVIQRAEKLLKNHEANVAENSGALRRRDQDLPLLQWQQNLS